jgi:hypothetical protein
MPLMMKRAGFPAGGWRAAAAWLAVAGVLAAAALILWQELRPPARLAPAPQRAVAVRAERLPGDGAVLGPFRLAGALALYSDDAGFGGLSGLAALPDGRLLAASDAGQWLRLRPVVAANRLRAVAGAGMGAIAAPAGDKTDLDSEAIAFTPDGRTLVSFEQRHRILAFAGIGPPQRPAGALYRTLALDWPPNGGGETLAVLPDGAWLWLSEAARAGGDARRALLIEAGGRTRQISVPGLAGFSPTDAAVLPDGRLLLLHRLFNGVSNEAAITLVDLAPVRAGGDAARARLLARWGPDRPWPVDNMEGLALASEAGKPVLYLVSDDNFSGLQRTLLLRLEIIAPLD